MRKQLNVKLISDSANAKISKCTNARTSKRAIAYTSERKNAHTSKRANECTNERVNACIRITAIKNGIMNLTISMFYLSVSVYLFLSSQISYKFPDRAGADFYVLTKTMIS